VRRGLAVVLRGGGYTVAFLGRELRGWGGPGAGARRRCENRSESGSGKRDRLAVELHDLLLWLDCSVHIYEAGSASENAKRVSYKERRCLRRPCSRKCGGLSIIYDDGTVTDEHGEHLGNIYDEL
jgi:hypothetical protein